MPRNYHKAGSYSQPTHGWLKRFALYCFFPSNRCNKNPFCCDGYYSLCTYENE